LRVSNPRSAYPWPLGSTASGRLYLVSTVLLADALNLFGDKKGQSDIFGEREGQNQIGEASRPADPSLQSATIQAKEK
jgi:hypothetical protein